MRQAIDDNVNFEELPFQLSLKKDDVVFISSDLKNLAFEAKKRHRTLNIDLFITNLQQAVSEGTIIIPAYTDHLQSGDTFDELKSKPTTGAISNKVFKRTDFKRTDDVLHSVLVWGKLTDEILALKDESVFGEYSIFGFMNRVRTVFVFIDVHIVNSFTFIHYVEEKRKVPYRKYFPLQINRIDKNKHQSIEKIKFHTKKPGVVTDFDELHETFIKTGCMSEFVYNQVLIHTISSFDAVKVTEQLLGQRKYLYHFSMKEWLKFFIKKVWRKKKGLTS